MFQYTLAISVPLIILWAVYRLALSSGTRLWANRMMLLSIYALSYYLFPAMRLFGSAGAAAPAGERALVISAAGSWVSAHLTTLAAVWAVGAGAMLLFTLYECFRIYTVVRRCRKTEVDGRTVWVSDDKKLTPFSFGRHVVINADDYARRSDMILAHELAHVSQHHTCDMLVAQFTVILCWYNPAAWLMRSELKMLHEYQADRAVLKSGYEATAYQKFLVHSAVSPILPTIGNKIHYGTLQRRISMMNAAPATGSHAMWRYALPLAGVIAAAFILNRPAVKEVFASVGAETLNTRKADVFVDGKEIPWDDLNSVPTHEIKSISIDKGRNRIDIYMKQDDN